MFKRASPEHIARSRRLRRDATEVEKRLWWKLRDFNKHGFHFRRQSPFRDYTLDFVEHDHKLVIELDGGQHGEALHAARDQHRDALLASQGYRTLRFWNTDVVENMDGVVEAIVRELERPPTRNAVRSDLPTRGRLR
jgi:crossover junction endodeoxyribonuclease RuvC